MQKWLCKNNDYKKDEKNETNRKCQKSTAKPLDRRRITTGNAPTTKLYNENILNKT